jgi:restriction endonuclease Mrr
MSSYPEGTKGMVITTSEFTAGAKEEAKKMEIILIDGPKFADLVAATNLR